MGIGTSNPGYKLEAFDNSPDVTSLAIRNGSIGQVWSWDLLGASHGAAAGNFVLYGPWPDALVMTPTGNLGLSSYTPTARLEIGSGNIKLDTPGSGLEFPTVRF